MSLWGQIRVITWSTRASRGPLTHRLVSTCNMAQIEAQASMAEALAAAATTPKPRMDHGFMFQQGFAGWDGPLWEVFRMGLAAAAAQM